MCNWLARIGKTTVSWGQKERIKADPAQVGYQSDWGEHHGAVSFEPDTWNYGSQGYPYGTSPMPLPQKLYHVTPFPDEISKEGFKTFRKPEEQTFGGHGTYVSFTNKQNAKNYQEALKEVVRAVNGEYPVSTENFDRLKDIGKRWGMSESQIAGALQYIKHNFVLEKWDSIDAVLEFLSHMHGYGAKNFPIIMASKEGLRHRLQGKSIDDVAILEVNTSPLDWHSGVNVRMHEPEEMKDRYTYNAGEQEWRVFNPQSVSNIKRIANRNNVEYLPATDEFGEHGDLSEQAYRLARTQIGVLSNKEPHTVAVINKQVVGALFVSMVANSFSFDIVVNPPFRRMGIAIALVQYALKEFKYMQSDIPDLKLNVDVINPQMRAILEKAGLSVVQTIRDDRVIMGEPE